jgi:hypothetical protein
MVVVRWVAEVGLICRQKHAIPLDSYSEDIRVGCTHPEFLDVDNANNIVAIVTERLDPLRFNVFVSKQIHQ